MGKLLNLAVYNPAILNDEDFLTGFVARGNLTEQILKRLKEIKSDNIVQHRLFIGQRGMGKTSMLRRIALGVEADSVLSSVLMPLTFREEQYNVHSLHVFWCNCLDALGDYFEKTGLHSLAVQVDKDVARLAREGKDEEGAAALSVFKELYKKQNKRPILLLDNIDFILEGLSDQEWILRRILQEPGGIIIIGATTGMLEASTKVEAPFYDFFQVHHLDRLSHEELVACLRQIAQKRGEPGRKVALVIDTDPARIHTLYDLTGGNPRTLVLLYMLLELDSESDVMEDLEQLLDQVTVLYKARVEDLPPQARVVLDAVALNWNPVTAAQIAAATSIDTSSVSPQLDRLQKLGIIEKVTTSSPSPIAYQLSERFFNIWYLMRNASRRQRNRLRWLTEFLKQFYTPQQLCTMAEKFMHRTKTDGRSAGMYGLAMADAVCEKSLRYALNHEATRHLDEYSRKIRAQLEEITDVTELNRSTLDMGALKQAVMNCPRNWSSDDANEFWDLLGGNPGIPFEQKQQMVSILTDLSYEKIEKLKSIMRKQLKSMLPFSELPEAFIKYQRAIREGVLNSSSDLAHALAAAKYYECEEILVCIIAFSTKTDFDNLSEDEFGGLLAALRNLFEKKDKKLNGFCFNHLAKFFYYASMPIEAEEALRKAIELNPKDANSWCNLGNLLKNNLERYEEAEAAFRKAIELNPKDANPWCDLGILLADKLGKYEEAEAAFRKAIELNPKDANPWMNLGILMADKLGQYEEAGVTIRKAIELDPKDACQWRKLGILLANKLGRYEEAETAFRKAIELDPKGAEPWINLGDLLADKLGRYGEAEAAFRKAIELDPKEAYQWNKLGNLLVDNLGRYGEAEAAYRKALEIFPDKDYLKINLAYFLFADPKRCEEAEHLFAEALNSLPSHGQNLLRAYRALAYDNFGEAKTAFAEALQSDSTDLFSCYYDDMLRVLRLAKARGYGERFLLFLEESGLAERYWPLHAAFASFLYGEAKLNDVNPEVRGAASRIYTWLVGSQGEKVQKEKEQKISRAKKVRRKSE